MSNIPLISQAEFLPFATFLTLNIVFFSEEKDLLSVSPISQILEEEEKKSEKKKCHVILYPGLHIGVNRQRDLLGNVITAALIAQVLFLHILLHISNRTTLPLALTSFLRPLGFEIKRAGILPLSF